MTTQTPTPPARRNPTKVELERLLHEIELYLRFWEVVREPK